MTLVRSPHHGLVAPQCSPELGTLLYSGSEVRLVLLVRHDGFVVFIPSLFVPIIHFAPKNYLNYKKGFKNIFFSQKIIRVEDGESSQTVFQFVCRVFHLRPECVDILASLQVVRPGGPHTTLLSPH